MSTTPQFGILTGMRKMTEQSMEQVRTAIHGYLQFFQRAVPGDVLGGSELSNKILGYAERNVASTFEFAQRLVQVKDVQDLVELQMEFIQSQMQAMTEQAKDLSETATKAMGQRENHDNGRPIVLIPDDDHGDHSVRSIGTPRGEAAPTRRLRSWRSGNYEYQRTMSRKASATANAIIVKIITYAFAATR